MELKEIFGIDPEELRDVMSRLETACICLSDMEGTSPGAGS